MADTGAAAAAIRKARKTVATIKTALPVERRHSGEVIGLRYYSHLRQAAPALAVPCGIAAPTGWPRIIRPIVRGIVHGVDANALNLTRGAWMLREHTELDASCDEGMVRG